jgi:ATP-binding cassette subfamily F protein uup
LLEELLEEYAGTVFLVSHDRTFLDNVVTQVIASEGNGFWREYVGGYTDWERQRPSSQPAAAKGKPDAKPAEVKPAAAVAAAPKKKLSYKEQRELDELPALIAKLETEQAEVSAKLADADLYKQKPEEVKRLNERFAELDGLLLDALEKWEVIEARTK